MESNIPQNVAEMLELLKTSVDQSMEKSGDGDTEKKRNVSDLQMQKELKKLYLSANLDYDAPEEEDAYVLDDDFLREINRETHKKKSASRSRNEESVSQASESVIVDTIPEDEDLAPWEDSVVVSSEEPETMEETVIEEEIVEEEIVEEEIVEEEIIEEEIIEEEIIEEEIIEEEIVEEPTMHLMDMSELGWKQVKAAYEAELAHDNAALAEEITEQTEDIVEEEALVLENEDTEGDLEDIDLMFENPQPPKHKADPSVVDLLLQFGCEDELEESIEEEQIDAYRNLEGSDIPYNAESSYVYDGCEYVSEEQTEQISESYRQEMFLSVRRLVGVSVLALLVLLYDLLPLLNVKLVGLLDYKKYPVAYLLLGLQLLLICCLPLWKKLFSSLRALSHLHFDVYALSLMSVFAVVLYDLSSLYMIGRDLPHAFHLMGALSLVAAAVSDHLLLCRERITFGIYSEEGAAYTLLKSEGKNSVADKMRKGGLPSSHTVRMPADVAFPNCYFRAVCEQRETKPIGYYLFAPVIVLSVFCGVGCMLLGNNLFFSLSAMPFVLLAALPSSALLANSIVSYVAAVKLRRRACAVAGKGAVDRYAETNLMVFRDRHLFAACKSEDVGVVFYDAKETKRTFSSLKALYDVIGGPMTSVLSSIPNEYTVDDVRIVRIFRNGIESVIAKKHVLIVGDARFMERYGLDFSDESDEQATAIPGRTALCVSINGAKTAKLTVKYTLEPLFEVLVERLAEEQIYCAVETQDPLIHSAMAADLRTRGRTPISVVHKSAKEMRTGVRGDGDVRREPTGILARRSRLHLAEIAIFCKRLRKIRRGITSATLIAGTVFFFAAAVVMFLGLGEWIDQYVLLLCHGVTAGLSVLLGLLHLPRKDHISLASYDREQETR